MNADGRRSSWFQGYQLAQRYNVAKLEKIGGSYYSRLEARKTIDLDEVWSTVERDLPDLKAKIQLRLRSAGNP